jgi:hypothetical protein
LFFITSGDGDPLNKENLMTSKTIGKKNTGGFLLLALSLMSVVLVSAVWGRTSTRNLVESIQVEPVRLQIPPFAQLQVTSCGEAVIVMTYNYAHPEGPLDEAEVIAYAAEMGYFTEAAEPFTSPADMVKIARRYTKEYSSGTVSSPDQGLALLIRMLKNGDPVIIDVQTDLNDPSSGAHFVVVTGMAVDPNDPGMITVYYNNPQTGVNESAAWGGDAGIWRAWRNNPDPGGSGWWLVISRS